MIRALFILLLSIAVHGQHIVTVASYNLLNYSSDPAREAHYRTIMSEIEPDLLVTQEMLSESGVNNFLNQVLNYTSTEYSAGDFIDGPDSDNAIFYRTVLFEFISNTPISTSLRDINEFKIVYLPTSDTLLIYSVHLKASQGSTNEQQRLAEVNSLRQVTDNHPAPANFIVCGDFNIYHSDEPAFQRLIDQSDLGYVLDPIDMPGYWHENISFAPIHTQSTRTRQFGGGASGGLDDRFDMILISQSISNHGGVTYVDGSYLAFGNDGFHFNDSINHMPNLAVNEQIANALHYASDHLPVICQLEFESVTGVTSQTNTPLEFGLRQYPNPFNGITIIEIFLPYPDAVEIAVYNIRGQLVESDYLDLTPGAYRYHFNGEGLSSGIYFCRVATRSGSVVTRKMILQK